MLNKTFTSGTVTIGIAFMGIPLPIPDPKRDACTLSDQVSCPILASPDTQFLGMSLDMPEESLACPISKDGNRDNCYTISLLFEDQDADTVACFDIAMTVVPAQKCTTL